jgi:glycosyltransferase domain-containing protein
MNSGNPLEDLTVVLVLKDRLQFTERWIEFNLIMNPGYKILIADGGFTPIRSKPFLEGIKKLNAEYVYYGQDHDLSVMTNKIYLALTKCKTKYVMLSSNDDFFLTKGLSNSVKFLEKNFDYISCSGKIQNFSVLPYGQNDTPYAGKVFIGDELYPGNGIHEELPIDRVQEFLEQDESFWHSVFRTQNLEKCYELARCQGNEDFILYDLFVNMHLALQGKHGRLRDSYSMLHQVHDEMEARNLVPKNIQSSNWWVKVDSLISVALAAFGLPDNSKSLLNEFEKNQELGPGSQVRSTKWPIRSVVQKFKYKYYKLSIMKVLDLLDPMTSTLARDSEVRNVQKFVLKYKGNPI